jgi:MYXO-CTERM domain-containing protein
MKSLLAAAACSAIVASSAHANLRITEVMSSSNGGGLPTPDWFEITNYGSTAVDLTGWRMDDGSVNFGVSVALNGITSIAAGQSIVFIESAAGAGLPAFNTFWGLSGVSVGYYSGSGVGLSSGGDGVSLFDSLGTLITSVTFGVATSGSSFFYGYDGAGAIDPSYNGVISTVGTLGTQVTYASTGDTSSIGTALGVPAPGAIALLGLAGIAGRARRR